jgi:hypothetical protein
MPEDIERGFVTPLRVENVDWKTWQVLERFRWVGYYDPPDIFDVEPGEFTDFATVPWWSQAILPRTGTWTKAAVLHDKMCNMQRDYYRLKRQYDVLIEHWELNRGWGTDNKPIKPLNPPFSSVDADAIFRKNARTEGTGLVRSELLWFGVRCGSLWDAHRRDEWLSTFPRFFFDLVWILAPVVAVIWWLWPW